MESFENKVCVITGAGKGFGLELSQLYLERGAKLALVTRSLEDVAKLGLLYEKKSKEVLIFQGDVSERRTVDRFADTLLEQFGRVDILINNAGMRFRRPFFDIKTEEFEKVLNCNLMSMVHMCQALLPSMVENRSGKVVNISSVLGKQALTDLSGYITSKAGVEGLTRALAVEFADFNINVNAVAPGFCKTSYYDDFIKNKPDLHKFTIDRTPAGRWGESNEVAGACLFLSSDLSSFVTGQTLHVDGGWSAC